MWRWTARLLSRGTLTADPSLVALPSGVRGCEVFRNVVSLEEEARIYEELTRILKRDGDTVVDEKSDVNDRTIKSTYLEIYGDKEYTEVRNWMRKEIRRVPGFVWFPTLQHVMKELAPPLLGTIPDTGRVVEHNLPGYEMHVEHPTVGSAFIYLNLLSDTVLDFDDESSGRYGKVFVPARALLHVWGESRWGFRFGELAEDEHEFRNAAGLRRHVETDLRVSVQLWKLNPGLLDSRTLQERLESAKDMRDQRRQEEEEKRRKKEDQAEAEEAVRSPEMSSAYRAEETVKPATSFMAGAFDTKGAGEGKLGGDYDDDSKEVLSASVKEKGKPMEVLKEEYVQYRDQFGRIRTIIEDMKRHEDAGQPINDLWIQRQMKESAASDTELDRINGFDSNNIEGTWDNAAAKAKFYKAKLRAMDYDGTAYANPTMPDFSKEAEGAVDIHTMAEKLAPHVKDGDKILRSLSPKVQK